MFASGRIAKRHEKAPPLGGAGNAVAKNGASGEERLLAVGAVADGGDAGAAFLGDEVQERLGGGREGGEAADARERLPPAGQGGVNRLALGEGVQRGGVAGNLLAVAAVGGADLDLVEVAQHVHLGDVEVGDAVDGRRVAPDDQIEPAAAAGAAGGGAELVPLVLAGAAQARPEVALKLRREGAGANAGGERLEDAVDGGEARRGDAGAGEATAGGGVGAGDEGVGAEVDVEHRALGALEEHVLAIGHRAVQVGDGVGDVGAEFFRRLQDLAQVHLVHFSRAVAAADGAAAAPGHRRPVVQEVGKFRGVGEVVPAQAATGRLVAVGRADALAGGAEVVLAARLLVEAVKDFVEGQDDVGAVADEEPPGGLDAAALQPRDFGAGLDRVKHHAVADDRHRVLAEDAAGDEVEFENVVPHHHGVPGVAAALAAHHDVRFLTEGVHDFAFALVAPLHSQDCADAHDLTLP